MCRWDPTGPTSLSSHFHSHCLRLLCLGWFIILPSRLISLWSLLSACLNGSSACQISYLFLSAAFGVVPLCWLAPVGPSQSWFPVSFSEQVRTHSSFTISLLDNFSFPPAIVPQQIPLIRVLVCIMLASLRYCASRPPRLYVRPIILLCWLAITCYGRVVLQVSLASDTSIDVDVRRSIWMNSLLL